MAGEITRSAFGERIKRLARQRYSPEQISEKLDGVITPERVRDELNAQLKEEDWLTGAQRRQLVLEDASEVLETAKDMLDEAKGSHDLKGQAALIASTVSAAKLVADRIDASAARNEDDMLAVQAQHAMVMMAGIQAMFDHAFAELRRRYPDIDEDEIRDVVTLSLPYANEAVFERVRKDDE